MSKCYMCGKVTRNLIDGMCEVCTVESHDWVNAMEIELELIENQLWEQ